MRSRNTTTLLLIAALFLTGASALPKKKQHAAIQLPSEAHGWKAKAGDRIFRGAELYDYIDGGGELYLSYGFKTLLSRKYTRPGQPEITLDLFDMGSSRNAFGVFSHSREKIEHDAGQGSEYGAGQMTFWKERYFVSLMSRKETAEAKKAIYEIAKKISETIPRQGPLPAILGLLPQKGLVPASVRYFRHHVWMNSHYFISDKNILHIDDSTEAVLAKYGRGPERPVLLLIEYASERKAVLARDNFIKHHPAGAAPEGAVRDKKGKWTAFGLYGRRTAVVFNAVSEKAALELIDAVKNNIQK